MKDEITRQPLTLLGKTHPVHCQRIQLPKIEKNTALPSQIQSMLDDLSHFLAPLKSLLFIVNDATRATRTEVILQKIIPLLSTISYKIIVATGTHKKPGLAELRQIFGNLLPVVNSHLIFHDAHIDEVIWCGKTKFGNDIHLNKICREVDGIIMINSVEPHYFAGFTGGRKSILPGIAGYDTIEYNHRLAMSEKAKNLRLYDNPVHLDMEEGVSFVKTPIFSIQLVQDFQNSVYSISSGCKEDSFYEAVETATKVYTVPVKEQADIIIAEVEKPLDRNFYQAHKALENNRALLKKGGIFILIAACQEGIGNAKFVETLNAFQTLAEVIEDCEKNYQLGAHKAHRIATFLQHSKLWLMSEINGGIIKQKNFKNESDFSFLLQKAIAKKSNDCTVFHIKQAASIAPLLID